MLAAGFGAWSGRATVMVHIGPGPAALDERDGLRVLPVVVGTSVVPIPADFALQPSPRDNLIVLALFSGDMLPALQRLATPVRSLLRSRRQRGAHAITWEGSRSAPKAVPRSCQPRRSKTCTICSGSLRKGVAPE